jgi:hypothetical protein
MLENGDTPGAVRELEHHLEAAEQSLVAAIRAR